MTYIYRVEDGKPIAEIINGTLRKDRARGSEHLLREPLSWALDLQVLWKCLEAGVHTVRICDTETGNVYKAPLTYFFAFGIELDRGHQVQVALPLERWQITGEDGRKVDLPRPQRPRQEVPAEQLGMFEEISHE